jgi:hypothetical protein
MRMVESCNEVDQPRELSAQLRRLFGLARKRHDGSEIQRVDNLHLRGNRNLCYESGCILNERPDNIL